MTTNDGNPEVVETEPKPEAELEFETSGDNEPDPEQERLKQELLQERQRNEQLMQAISSGRNMDQGAGVADPETGVELSLREVVDAARNPQHPLHAQSVAQLVSIQATRELNQRLDRMEAAQAYRDAMMRVPREHRDQVHAYMNSSERRVADPESAFLLLKGAGKLKPTPPRKGDGTFTSRAAAAPGLPTPSAPVSSPGPREARKMRRSDYYRDVVGDPSLRDEKDNGLIELVDG